MRFVDATEKRQRFVQEVVKDLVSSFILLTLLQVSYTLSITDEEIKKDCATEVDVQARANDLH